MQSDARTIVVVEDSSDAREALQFMLQYAGHTVITASDGVEGLEKIRAIRPDVSIIDLRMPRMDGFELARRVREELTDGMLIALTGFGQAGELEKARAAGFDAFLVKPASMDELTALIYKH